MIGQVPVAVSEPRGEHIVAPMRSIGVAARHPSLCHRDLDVQQHRDVRLAEQTRHPNQDIDSACKEAGLWPDIVLSGHAHLYQRFTRKVDGREIPYIVAGSGGHNVTLPRGEVIGRAPITWGEYTLVKEPVLKYGYLTVTVDMSARGKESLSVTFQAPSDQSVRDVVTVNLSTHALMVG